MERRPAWRAKTLAAGATVDWCDFPMANQIFKDAMMRYPTHLKVLDGFGIAALLSSVSFALMPDRLRPTTHVDDIWGGLSTEMLGIWVGVRFIEWIINSHEDANKARVRILRHMRFMERLAHNVLEFQRSYELRMLLRDWHWGRERFESRKKHLSRDEVIDVMAFF
jgi:hypothetical protein